MARSKLGGIVGILIVEDEAIVRLNAVDVIENAGFKVYEASDADEAIHMLERHKDIRLVFTDINMPGSMDGLKLAHYIRGRWPPVKLIITSGEGAPPENEIPVGSVFFAKPYDSQQIARSLRDMTGRSAEH